MNNKVIYLSRLGLKLIIICLTTLIYTDTKSILQNFIPRDNFPKYTENKYMKYCCNIKNKRFGI